MLCEYNFAWASKGRFIPGGGCAKTPPDCVMLRIFWTAYFPVWLYIQCAELSCFTWFAIIT